MVCQIQSWCSIGIKAASVGLLLASSLSGIATALPAVKTAPSTKVQSIKQGKPASLTDTSVVPGVQFGPITAKTTYADLVKQFGAASLTDARPPDAKETEREFGTRVNLGPDWSMLVVWQDKTKAKPFEIVEMGSGWQFPGGLQAGMPFSEVARRLGPFDMVGLGGPYGGVIPLRGTTLQQHFGKLIVQMAPVEGADKRFPQAYKALEGERLIPSSDRNWQALGMTVKYIVFPFPR